MLSGLSAQEARPISVKVIAPAFGVNPLFMDDTAVVRRYLDSIGSDNHALADSCVAINARVLAFQSIMLYDYPHRNDTVWVDENTYLMDYNIYAAKLSTLSDFVLKRAHDYIEREHIRQDAIQQNAFNLIKDTIARQHRTIVNACEGFGVSDSDRKKELKDLYYAYLTVYNRYDLSAGRTDEAYVQALSRFAKFQNHLIDNLLSTNNINNRIKNFTNTLKIRCGRNHSDILRSYQRVFRTQPRDVSFSNIKDYYKYIDSLQTVMQVQEAYLSVIELREKITANSDRINRQYGSRFHDVVRTYREVANSVNTVPAFYTLFGAKDFIDQMQEFIQVQDCYLQDYTRLMTIREHGDTIVRRCSMRYSDVSKAYNTMLSDLSLKSGTPMPNYRTLDDAVRFSTEMDRFEIIQRQYDSIIDIRRTIDRYKDSISKGWMSHMTVYNGYQSIRKKMVMTPSFIDIEGGSRFINDLRDFVDTQEKCLEAIRLYNEYRRLDDVTLEQIQPFRNIRKAYSRLEKTYLTIKAINHTSELFVYCRQLESFISVQNDIIELVKNNQAPSVDNRLANNKDIDQIEKILGL